MGLNQGHKELVFLHMRMPRMVALMVFCLLMPVFVHAEEKGKVAVLPFRVYAPKPLDHLRRGLQEMLTARLARKGLSTISPDVIDRHPSASLPVIEQEDILAMGKDMGADWVITGSLTQIGTKISLDMKVFDITGKKPPFSLFVVEDNLDKLSDVVQRASASIYNQITGILQIDSIQVKGNKRIESAAILAMVESKKGDGLDPDQLNKDLRAIYKLGFFTDVSIETEEAAKGRVVIFNVREKPSIAQILFEGNEEEKDKELKEQVGIKEYSILNRGEIKQSVNRLREYYHQKGYYNVEIKERTKELPQNEVSLIYEIKEGGKIYIRRIEFVGNSKFDDDDLKDIMENTEKGFLSWFTKSGLLDKKKLEFDAQKITSFYHNQGYMKAKVGEPKISYEKEEEGLIITIDIMEGPQYRVNEVKIEGDLIRPADELLKRVQIKEEEFFSREVVRKDSRALTNAYADDGYAYAAISPGIEADDENYLVDITYRISKGKRVRFERINITGNTITRDKVIRRELRVIEGEYFSGAALGRSNQNLYRLGYFEDVEVQTKKGSQDDLMVLDINVKEQPTGSFSFGAGYSEFESFIGNFNISQKNLFGRGQKLSGTATVGGRTTNIDVSFTEPWLFDRPIAGSITFYTWERQFDEYTRDSFGGGLRVGFPLSRLRLDEFTRGWVRYAYDDAEILDVAENAAQSIKDMEGQNKTSSIALGISRNSRDKPFLTTKGSLNSFSFETAGGFLGGTVEFNKYLATTLWYFPLFWDTVFVAQGRAGYVQETGEPIPVFQKFRIGGINTVRGFEAFSISPRDPRTLEPIGGEEMLIFNAEYRFPLFKEQGVVGVVFFDAGNVFTDDPTALTVSGLRTGAGGGIRWFSPIGPLRLEYGFNLDPKEEFGEKKGEWYLSMGGEF